MTPTPLPESVLLESMNYQRQALNNCGPASVAILLGYYGHQVTQYEVNEIIPPGSLGGLRALLPQYQLMARAYRTPPSRNALRQLLANGIPVIVNQWLSVGSDIRHYRVIKGYDDEALVFISDDPLRGVDLHIDYDTFLKLSRPGGIIAVYPPRMDRLVRSMMKGLWMTETPI
jgi:ABC-type bacteriocin/lantibiotic exporter with double-glycine peptidase domain